MIDHFKLQDSISLVERLQAPVPKFFQTIRFIGLIVGGLGSMILASPVALPVALTTIAGYLVTAGAVAATVSQTTVDWKKYRPSTGILPHNL